MSNEAPMHFVYVVAHQTGDGFGSPVKVGITKSLRSSLKQIQTGNYRLVDVAYYFVLPSRDMALEAEREFHNAAAEHRLVGEWFDMDPLYALETLVGIVFDMLEGAYQGEDRQAALAQSNAVDNLHTVTTEFWGLPE